MIYGTSNVKISFPVSLTTFVLFALVSFVIADQFHTMYGPRTVRWQVEQLNTGQLQRFDGQIDASLAVIEKGRPASGTVAARSISGTATTAAYFSLSSL